MLSVCGSVTSSVVCTCDYVVVSVEVVERGVAVMRVARRLPIGVLNAALASVLIKQVVVVKLFVVFADCSLDLGCVNPRHEILHLTRHQEGRVSYRLRADAYVALLDELHGFLYCLRHFYSEHDNRESSTAERRSSYLVMSDIMAIDES